MNPSKLQQQQAQEASLQQDTTANAGVEFPTAEEAIRYDAAHTDLPPSLAERLKKSVEQEPRQAESPWWKRLLGG